MVVRVRLKLLLVSLAILLPAGSAHAGPKAFIDGYELLRLCESAALLGSFTFLDAYPCR